MGNTPPKNGRCPTSHIHKKGSQRDPKKLQRIAVICATDRIYSKVLRNLTETEIYNNQAKEQSGFNAARSTIDNIFTLKSVIEKQIQGREMHVA
jgi:hypothetical protein